MKLPELKLEVYRIAKVTTTKQLKAQHKQIKPLDLRYKISWEQALEQLQHSLKVEETSSAQTATTTDFDQWLNDPPSAYRDLFAEADAALTRFDDKLNKTKRLTKTAKAMAASLDEFAEATVEEAQRLASD